MKVNIVLEHLSREDATIQGIFATIDQNIEKLCEPWVDIPVEGYPPKLIQSMGKVTELAMGQFTDVVKFLTTTNVAEFETAMFIRNRLATWGIVPGNIVRVTVTKTSFLIECEI